jgi:hypothetical protein
MEGEEKQEVPSDIGGQPIEKTEETVIDNQSDSIVQIPTVDILTLPTDIQSNQTELSEPTVEVLPGSKDDDSLIPEPIPEEKITGRGGWRPNSGRPKGSKDRATLDREIVAEEIRQRVLNHSQELINAQLSLARGETRLIKVITEGDGKSAKRKHVMVTDPNEIIQFLDGDFEGGEDYYYIATDKPDTRAIDSLLDRIFGRANQSIELKGGLDINKFNKLSDDDLDNQLDELGKEVSLENGEGGEVKTPPEKV